MRMFVIIRDGRVSVVAAGNRLAAYLAAGTGWESLEVWSLDGGCTWAEVRP